MNPLATLLETMVSFFVQMGAVAIATKNPQYAPLLQAMLPLINAEMTQIAQGGLPTPAPIVIQPASVTLGKPAGS